MSPCLTSPPPHGGADFNHISDVIFDAIVIANGQFPTHPIPLSFLNATMISNKPLFICCDGAVQNLINYGLEPDIIIGDLDSITAQLKEQYHQCIIKIADQQSNDQSKAVNYCMQKGYKKIAIIGATGLREDHTLANIFLLLEYHSTIEVLLATDYGFFCVVKNSAQFQCATGTQVSIFNPLKGRITSTGLNFPLTHCLLDNLWQGSLNQCDTGVFTIETDQPIILFQTY